MVPAAVLMRCCAIIPFEQTDEIRMIFETGSFGDGQDGIVCLCQQFSRFLQTAVIQVFYKSCACKGFEEFHKIGGAVAAESCSFSKRDCSCIVFIEKLEQFFHFLDLCSVRIVRQMMRRFNAQWVQQPENGKEMRFDKKLNTAVMLMPVFNQSHQMMAQIFRAGMIHRKYRREKSCSVQIRTDIFLKTAVDLTAAAKKVQIKNDIKINRLLRGVLVDGMKGAGHDKCNITFCHNVGSCIDCDNTAAFLDDNDLHFVMPMEWIIADKTRNLCVVDNKWELTAAMLFFFIAGCFVYGR